VTFAAFPLVYAVMFSSLYSALMLILFALILRGVAFEFRSQVDDPRWRAVWDICVFAGSSIPALLFGVAFANIFRGLPIDNNGVFQGNLLTLLNPYGLLGGVLFVMLFLVHGSLWLAIKTPDPLHRRARDLARRLWLPLVAVAVGFLIASAYATRLYENYLAHPALFGIVVWTVVALLAMRWFIARERLLAAWAASAATIAGAVFFGIAGLFPNLYPSSLDPAWSLTAFNASSSPLTLKIMLTVVAVFIPVVIAYQVWAYRLFHAKITAGDLAYEEAY